MATHQQVPTDPLDLSSNKAEAHVDRMLDAAIADSFPNSDPVALAMPHDRVESTASRALQIPSGLRDVWPLMVIGGIIAGLLFMRR
jgi:hypothetical protein